MSLANSGELLEVKVEYIYIFTLRVRCEIEEGNEHRNREWVEYESSQPYT